MLKMTYVMDMIIAGTLLVVSVCLILVAFVVLWFTISFVLTEEYREIGCLKAIGISSVKIRSLYMVKYFVLVLTGATIGFLPVFPLAKCCLTVYHRPWSWKQREAWRPTCGVHPVK